MAFYKHTNKEENDDYRFLFTSESVGQGHPDKICDQISDAILDACLKEDPNSRVACEVATKNDMILVFGEMNSAAKLDFQSIVRNKIQEIGYDSPEKGFDYKTCTINVSMNQQSPEISSGVESSEEMENFGAGDQGMMFGYATNETDEMIPFTLLTAHRIVKELDSLRKNPEFDWLYPDCKSQVTAEYTIRNGCCIPIRIHTIVISAQHSRFISPDKVRSELNEKIIKTAIPNKFIDHNTIIHINPCGKFTVGGPMSDAGLTGRKIIVDTYGGWGAHGGGAFSGKDWSKVDRSAAYAARWITISLVAAGLCKRVLLQISYAIGLPNPINIFVETYGTGIFPTDRNFIKIINDNFDLRPGCIAKELGLTSPIFQNTAKYGHFGRQIFPWETPKKLKFDLNILNN